MDSDIGTTEFVSDLPGFSCVFKERYQDFIVHEIDQSNTVIRLTELSAPETVAPVSGSDVVLSDLIGSDVDDKLQSLVESNDASASVDIQSLGLTKEQRTEIHHQIRMKYNGLIDTCTATKDDVQLIIARKSSKQTRKRKFWPSDRGDYCHFTMFKINKDSHYALAVVSRMLGLKSDNLHVAGTKDKRAVTTQRVCTYKMEASRLAELNKKLIGIQLGNFIYKTTDIGLGDLSGNLFTIILRNIEGDQEIIEKKCESLKTRGFINYYGSQRFGTSEIATWRIGLAILRGNWKEAVDLILANRDDEELSGCLKIWNETRDPQKAITAVKGSQRHTKLETILLKGLKRHGSENYSDALHELPRNSKNLYVHSYQSLIWNKMASLRVKEFGLNPCVGDLVLNSDGTEKIVTDSDLANVSAFDVVLPLASANMTIPANEVGTFYRNLLREDGISVENFATKAKDFCLSGAYRPLFIQPKNMSFEFVRYSDPTVPLAFTDIDIMQSEQRPENVSKVDGPFEALKIEFSLPAGCYATMAIRELTKIDMSKQHQSTLNDYSKSRTKTVCDGNVSLLQSTIDSPIGVLHVKTCSYGIHSLQLSPDLNDEAFESNNTQVKLLSSETNPLLDRIVHWLSAYFDGKQLERPPICILNSEKSTFQVRCLSELAKVPWGETVSYGELAKRSGSSGAAQAVGQALHNNPVMLILPCHRVRKSNGDLGGFCGLSRLNVKKWLWKLENIN